MEEDQVQGETTSEVLEAEAPEEDSEPFGDLAGINRVGAD